MLSLLDILRRVDSGALAPADAVRLSYDAIDARDGEIQAFVELDRGAAAGRGPLAGVAVAVKDIIDVEGLPTRMGSPIYDGWRPRGDAAAVSLLRRAGATPVGKTETTPFAYLDPVATRNPRNPAHTPGGSSSGSAAAVAAGMVPLALGTQTGGSVIRPASYCGVAGVKPSYRLLPTTGVKGFSWTLDTVGLFGAGVADVALALASMTGRDELQPPDEPAAPRFGLVLQDFAGAPEPAAAAALEEAVRAVERAGASVVPLALPPIFGEAFRLHGTIQDFEARQALAWEYDRHRDALPPLLGGALDAAQTIPAAAYDSARGVARRARGAMRDVFGNVDALLAYAAPGAAPETLRSTGDSRFNRLWTLLGAPCVSVPGLSDGRGLPVGVQVIGPFGADETALRAALFVERAIGRSLRPGTAPS